MYYAEEEYNEYSSVDEKPTEYLQAMFTFYLHGESDVEGNPLSPEHSNTMNAPPLIQPPNWICLTEDTIPGNMPVRGTLDFRQSYNVRKRYEDMPKLVDIPEEEEDHMDEEELMQLLIWEHWQCKYELAQ